MKLVHRALEKDGAGMVEFILKKYEWDSVHLERIELATDPGQSADVTALIMAEGVAQVCLVTGCMNVTREEMETGFSGSF